MTEHSGEQHTTGEKAFADYAAKRAQQASPEETAWVEAFDATRRPGKGE